MPSRRMLAREQGRAGTMDWNRAIERNSEALRKIVALLFAMLGAAGGRPLSVRFADTSSRERGEVELDLLRKSGGVFVALEAILMK
jgi:hypothetical protein